MDPRQTVLLICCSTLLLLLLLTPSSEANRAGKATPPKPPHPNRRLSSIAEYNRTQSANNVTFLLNHLLNQYDNSLRPDIGGPPLKVDINMQVRSMGPISEMDMSYSMDCYFRQSWVDRRLAFSGQKNLALSIEMLRKIWKPDTYIYNGRKSYLHTITTPNKFMRLFPNGRVLYSQRLTIRASCQMDLSDFPMDKQRCPLEIGSFGYTHEDVVYQWTSGRGVNIASDMKLSQFDLISTPTGNATLSRSTGTNQHSTLMVSFHLQRHMGNFVIQVYGPCVLLVVISWVSFWLNREATSDRISLGVTTVLTMTFLGLEARTDLPQVSYPTALDYFVFISFMFIFATVAQFALVHYFTKVGAGEYYLEELEETTCLLEVKRKMLLQNGFAGGKNGDAVEYQDEEEEVLTKSDCVSFVVGDSVQPQDYFENHRILDDDSCYFPPCVDCELAYSSNSLPLVNNPYEAYNGRNVLNHHPYGTFFYYNKKNGNCGVKRKRKHGKKKARSADEMSVPTPPPPPPFITSASSAASMTTPSAVSPELLEALQLSDADLAKCGCKRCITRAMNNPEKALNSVSTIDKISRVVFPATFLSLNLFYWYSYLKHSERIDLSFETS